MADKLSKVKWGDVEESSDTNEIISKPFINTPSITSTKPNADGIKTVTEYYINDRGERVKVIRTIKVIKKQIRVNKNIAERRKWKKFGDCAGVGPGPEENVTITSTELMKLDLRPKKREEENKEEDPVRITSNTLICRNCGQEGHFTLRCPKRSQLRPNGEKDLPPSESSAPATQANTPGKYIPMHRRGGDRQGTSYETREEATLRVTNLSEDTTDVDLSYLFRTFGNTSRIYLAKDRNTNKSRGFAFINFIHRADAQAAIDKLNGYGYDNLILQVEWAKPREDKPRTDLSMIKTRGLPSNDRGARRDNDRDSDRRRY